MTNQIRPYEPLTSQNGALVLADHQVGRMTGRSDVRSSTRKGPTSNGIAQSHNAR